MSLHPLHTEDFLIDQIKASGTYPDRYRRTSRSTVIALDTIARALAHPGLPVHIRDHHDSAEAHRELAYMIRNYSDSLGLRHLWVNAEKLTLTFERKR